MNKFLIILLMHILPIAIYAQTADEFRTKANNGDAYSQYALGWCYSNGKGVVQDDSQAFQWYMKAAEKDYPRAQIALGLCYRNGNGVTRNIFEAFSWFKKAADQKEVDAYYYVGYLSLIGAGTEKDSIEGLKYLLMAAEQNDVRALRYLGNEYMHGRDISPNTEKALQFLQKAIDLGDAKAAMDLADHYSYGKYIRQDIEKAKELLQPFIEIGDKNAILITSYPWYGLKRTEKTNNNTFALIISNDQCENYLYEPSFLTDASTFELICEMTFGIPKKHIHHVASPTLSNLIKELDWLSNVMDAYDGDANIIIYYAGPGVSDVSTLKSYILPADGDALDPSSGLSLNELYETLSKMPSKSVVVFIDACFNGARRNGEMLTSARGIKIKAKPAIPTGNIVVFNASQEDETAWVWSEEGRGLFSYAILNAIKEEEDQGDLTLGGLAPKIISYVKKTAVGEMGVSQTPNILASPELEDKWKNWKLTP